MTQGMSVRTKLFFSFGLVLLVAAVASAYSVFAIRHLRNVIQEEIVSSSARLDDTRQITISIGSMRSAMRGISLFSLQHNAMQTQKARDLFDKSAGDIRQILDRLKSATLNAQDEGAVTAIGSGLNQWAESFRTFTDLAASGHAEESFEFALKNMTPVMDAVQKNVIELGKVNRVRQDAAVLSAGSSAQFGAILIVVLASSVLIVGAAAFWVLAELAKALNGIAQSVANSAHEVNRSSEQMAQGSQSLAESMTEQAASVEETSASTQELSSSTKQTLTDSGLAAEMTSKTMRNVEETVRLLDSTVASMEAISGSSKKISQIISVIEGIAFQTNILALNAAVEAARAGEAGMGFAVVADEVRNLARRSAEAASDTARLISESIENARRGSENFNRLSEAFRTITAATVEVDKLVSGFSASSHEQTNGVAQIAKAMEQIEQVTQRSAAAAEEGSATSHEMKEQAAQLNNLAGQLAILTGTQSNTTIAA